MSVALVRLTPNALGATDAYEQTVLVRSMLRGKKQVAMPALEKVALDRDRGSGKGRSGLGSLNKGDFQSICNYFGSRMTNR